MCTVADKGFGNWTTDGKSRRLTAQTAENVTDWLRRNSMPQSVDKVLMSWEQRVAQSIPKGQRMSVAYIFRYQSSKPAVKPYQRKIHYVSTTCFNSSSCLDSEDTDDTGNILGPWREAWQDFTILPLYHLLYCPPTHPDLHQPAQRACHLPTFLWTEGMLNCEGWGGQQDLINALFTTAFCSFSNSIAFIQWAHDTGHWPRLQNFWCRNFEKPAS